MPEVVVQPNDSGSLEAAMPLIATIKDLGPEWDATLHPKERREVPEREQGSVPITAFPPELLYVILGATAKPLAEVLIEAFVDFARDRWRETHRKIEIVVVTEDGEEIRHVKAP